MNNKYNTVIEKLKKYNQNEIINLIENRFTEDEAMNLIDQIEELDLEKITNLYKNAKNIPQIDQSKIEHISCKYIGGLTQEQFKDYKTKGEEIIKTGKYAVVTMAGGQGTRLGHDGPKGTFKIETVKGEKYLFQIIVEALSKANRKYGVTIPWFIMTSSENNAQTVDFMEQNNYFGYPKEHVTFFKQGNLPMIKDNGNLAITKNKLVRIASDGNGSIYQSLKHAGLIEKMKADGIEWIFVGGVDNILLRVVDPILVGITIEQGNLISSKSVIKKDAHEKVGVFCKLNGVPKVIEYTELPKNMCEATNEEGQLVFGEVNILSHLFNIEALEKLSGANLAYHTAHKKCDYVNENGEFIKVTEPNAYKFESYIFDGFSLFDDMSILRVNREDEFAPIKNAEGNDSPETATKLYNDYIKRYGEI